MRQSYELLSSWFDFIFFTDLVILGYTTRKSFFYDADSKIILWNCLRIWRVDNFVIRWGIKIDFYNAHSKTIISNRLKMCLCDNVVIIENENNDGFCLKLCSFSSQNNSIPPSNVYSPSSSPMHPPTTALGEPLSAISGALRDSGHLLTPFVTQLLLIVCLTRVAPPSIIYGRCHTGNH